MDKEGLSMDQAVLQFYRRLLKEYFPNSGELNNASIYVEAEGPDIMNCSEAGNYMKLYLQVEGQYITEMKYLCTCEPAANVAVEILCGLVKDRTLEEALSLREEDFYQVIGSQSEELGRKAQGLLELLHKGIASYKPAQK
jgi:NifU-like protein involved in Fe-S cluster formation